MAPLLNRVTNAVFSDDDKALKDLLPEILASHASYSELGRALIPAAAHGYFASYNVIIGEVLKRTPWPYDDLERALSGAIDGHHHQIVDDLLDKVLQLRDSLLDRNNILHFALRSAARVDNVSVAKRILEEDLRIRSFDAPLSIACSYSNLEIVALMIESLMRKKTEDEQSYTSPFHGNTSSVFNLIQGDRARVLETSLKESIQRRFHSITAVLLPPYLECAATYSTHRDLTTKCEILNKIDVEVYANLSREQNFKFLSMEIPTTAKQNIFCRLRTDSAEEPMDVQLSAQDQTFDAHKDVLCYWSSYFSALFRNEWKDSDHVRFGEELSAGAMKVVVDFVYSGIFVYDAHADIHERLKELAELLSVADYFDIDALKQQVQVYRSARAS